MPDPHELLTVVSESVQKGEADLLTAAVLLKLGSKTPADIVCFHAQQCTEKYLKAFLNLRQIRFPKTHDISQIVAFFPQANRPPLDTQEKERLMRYATIARYPEDERPPVLADAREAVKVARRVRSWRRNRLPPAALRKTRPS